METGRKGRGAEWACPTGGAWGSSPTAGPPARGSTAGK